MTTSKKLKVEKIKTIFTARKTYEAGLYQFWAKSKGEKLYRLWDETLGVLCCIKSIPAKKVFWVIPFDY